MPELPIPPDPQAYGAGQMQAAMPGSQQNGPAGSNGFAQVMQNMPGMTPAVRERAYSQALNTEPNVWQVGNALNTSNAGGVPFAAALQQIVNQDQQAAQRVVQMDLANQNRQMLAFLNMSRQAAERGNATHEALQRHLALIKDSLDPEDFVKLVAGVSEMRRPDGRAYEPQEVAGLIGAAMTRYGIRPRTMESSLNSVRRFMGAGASGEQASPGMPPAQGSGALDLNRVRALESPTGAPNAMGSGATGPYQIMPQLRGSFPPGTPDEEIVQKNAEANKRIMEGRLGRPVTQDELFLAHRLGAGGALAVLQADPNAPIADVLRPVFNGTTTPPLEAVLRQNPYLERAGTAGGLVNAIRQQWGGAGNAGGLATPASQPGASAGGPTLAGMPITPELLAALAASGDPRLRAMANILAPSVRQQTGTETAVVPDPSSSTGFRYAQRSQVPGQEAPNPRNPPANTFERTADKLAAERFDAMQQNALDASRRAPVLQALQSARQFFRTGIDAGARITLGQIGNALGINTPETSYGEFLTAAQRQMELLLTPRGQGQITENERKLIRDQVAVLTSTPEGAARILDLIEKQFQWDRSAAQRALQKARTNGGTPDALMMADLVQELGPRPSIEDIAGAQLAPQPGTSGGWSIRPAP